MWVPVPEIEPGIPLETRDTDTRIRVHIIIIIIYITVPLISKLHNYTD